MTSKTIIAILASCLLSLPVLYGQDVRPFFPPLGEGVVLVYEDTDGSGNHVSFTENSTVAFSGDFNDGSASVLSVMVQPEDTTKFRMRVPMLFSGGEVITDIASMMRDSMKDAVADASDADSDKIAEVMDKVTVSGESRGIPSDISVGMTLPDYGITMKIMFVKVKINVSDRKVSGREKLVTPAGTFDCYVVEEQLSVKAMVVNEKSLMKTWYAHGVGVIKQETWKKDRLESSTVLYEYRMPDA